MNNRLPHVTPEMESASFKLRAQNWSRELDKYPYPAVMVLACPITGDVAVLASHLNKVPDSGLESFRRRLNENLDTILAKRAMARKAQSPKNPENKDV